MKPSDDVSVFTEDLFVGLLKRVLFLDFGLEGLAVIGSAHLPNQLLRDIDLFGEIVDVTFDSRSRCFNHSHDVTDVLANALYLGQDLRVVQDRIFNSIVHRSYLSFW